MKRGILLLILLVGSSVVYAENPHNQPDVINNTDNSVTDNSTTVNNYYYGEGGDPISVVSNEFDKKFNAGMAMGMAATGVIFRARRSLQWGASMSRVEEVGALGFGLAQEIHDNKLLLSGKIVIEDQDRTNAWVVGISGGF